MEREIIIVGAGPGGATAAMALAQQGHDVLLLDRQRFPRDKVCGDGIPAGVFEMMYEYGMREKVAQAGFYPVTQMRIVSPQGYNFDGDLSPGKTGALSHVVPRLQFDAMLQEHAVVSGAEFCQAKVEEPILENGQVKGVRAKVNGGVKEIRSKIVIAADGVTSVIARALQPEGHQDLHRAVALRAYIDDIDVLPHQVEFFLYKGILPGYAWIFPNGENRANIGLGMRLDKFRRRKGNLKELLRTFLEIPTIKERLRTGWRLHSVSSWQLNFGSQKNLQRAYGGAMLTGDAGGFINPLTGGGIHNAMISARLAAKTAHQALLAGDVSQEALKVYDTLVREELWKGLYRSYMIQRWLLLFPRIVDVVVRQANQDSTFARTFMTKL
ncbi:MAG: NAD(P)/FAD-dependent oxidoreductase [Ardenticatenaceae bacterium]|nr:NAD(P)/FAD-dependent oxidoreductase [Anaerolineales bacterium]MCB8918743.1 NAD(P)/FAD-dependent oxidoreductase [Ardenticatenaceae bacterium]